MKLTLTLTAILATLGLIDNQPEIELQPSRPTEPVTFATYDDDEAGHYWYYGRSMEPDYE